MKSKKIVAGILAAAITLSSFTVNGFAETSWNESNTSVADDSESTADDANTELVDIAITGPGKTVVDGGLVRTNIINRLILDDDATIADGNSFKNAKEVTVKFSVSNYISAFSAWVSMASSDWNVQYWGEDSDGNIKATGTAVNVTGNGEYEATVTFDHSIESMVFIAVCTSLPADDADSNIPTLAIESISAVIDLSAPSEPTPGDASGGIEEPDEPYPGDSSGYVPEPGEDETDYIETVCSSVEQLQTPHPYKNNSYYSYTYTDESCSNLKVTFSEDSYTEQGCDTVTIYDETGEECTTLSGNDLSGTSVLIPGNTVKIVLTTDSSVTDYGFSVESVENADEVPKQGDPEYDFVIGSEANIDTDEYIYYLKKYKGTGGDIVIPSEINGKKIEKIGNGAFSGNTSLTSITIPDSVTSIGYEAFKGCTSLKSVNIPDSVKTVDSRAFLNCTSLKSITIPEGVQNIYDYAFGYITDTDSDAIIKDEDFVINYVSGSTAHYYAYSNGFTDEKYFTDAKYFITSEKDDGTIRITGTTGRLRSAIIPEYINGKKVTEIAWLYEEHMMSDTIGIPFSYLDSVYIPKTVEYISGGSFRSCWDISIIEVDEDNPYYTSKNNVLYNKDMTELVFHSSGLYDNIFVIPDGVKTIGANAFSDNTTVEEIILGANVTVIEDNAFENCRSLKTISIPEGVTKIGDNAFERCIELKSVTLPETLVTVGYAAFSNCTSLTEIYIPAGVTTLGEAVFSDCTGLEKIEVSENNKNYCSKSGVLFDKDVTKLLFYPIAKTDKSYTVPDGIVEIGSKIFSSSKSLTEIKIPDSVKKIGYGAFMDCVSLVDINLPDSITDIDMSAFNGCSSLENITLPKNLKVIKNATFYNCEALKTVVLPDGLETIESLAFDTCTSLDNVVIPDSVTVIEQSAFSDCTSLGNIKMSNNVTAIGSRAFEGTLFVNNQNTDVKYLANWAIDSNRNAENITVKEGTIGLAGGIFSYNQKLNKVTLPDSLRYIGEGAFIGCSALASVTVPDGVTKLDYETFEYCSSLTEVNLPDSISDIHSSAFFKTPYLKNQTDSVKYAGKVAIGCDDNVEKILVKDGTLAIGGYAFDYNKSITEVILPNSLRVINKEAFYDCTGLKSIVIPASVKTIGEYAIGYYSDDNWNQIKDDGFKIYCYAGTAGEQYAKDNGFDYELLECKEHKFGDWSITKAATCTAEGTQTGTCSVCGKTETQTIKALGHNYSSAWTTDKAATCGTAGSKSHHCTRCSAKSDVTAIPATGKHDFNDWTITKAETYTATGTKTRTCKVCKKTETATIAKRTLAKVGGFKVKAKDSTSITLQWNKNNSASGYIIEAYNGKTWVQVTKIAKNSTLTYKVTKLSASKTYQYRIKAYKTEGKTTAYSANSATLSVNTNPSNMSGFKAKAKSYNSITLQWNKNTSATGYELQKWDGKKWVTLTKISKNSTTTYTVKSLKASTTYKYKIRAYKTIGKATQYSAYTATLSVNTNPANMSGFKAKAKSYNSITLQWNKNTSATGYELQKWDGKKWVTLTKISKNSTTTYTVKSLKASTTYKYRIRAYKTIGKVTQYSAYSATLSVNTNPTNMNGFKAKSKSYNSITLQWNKNASATGYELQKWDGKKWVTLTKINKNSTTTYTVKSLKASTTYKYRIRAYKTIGKATQYSGYSATLSVNTNPSNMSGFKAKSKSYNSITLQWNKNTSATGYEVQKWDGKKWVTLTKISKNSTTTYTVKSLRASTTYKYRIRAYKTIGKVTQYSAYSATLSVNTNPTNMSGFKAKSTAKTSVTLQWNKNTSATGYEIQKWNGKKWVSAAKVTKNSTVTSTVKSLKKNTSYKFRIRAYKTIGKATQYSAYTATLSVNTNPSNMSGFKAKSTAKTSVTLQWNKNTSATGYEIQKWNGKKWVSAAKVTKNSTVTSTVKSLKKNTSYKFRIRAYKTIGKATQYSSWSGTLTVKTKK